MLPNDNVSMSVGYLDHILIVYSSMEHVTWKSPGPMCGWVGRILHEDVHEDTDVHESGCRILPTQPHMGPNHVLHEL